MRVLWPHNFDPAIPNSQLFIQSAAKELRQRGIELHLEYLGNLRSIPNLIQARSHLQKISSKFDLVHAQYGSACALAVSAIRGIPKVLSIRGNDWNLHNGSINFHYFHTRLAKLMTRVSINQFDCVITVSRRVSNDVKQFFPKALICVLPTPIDLDRFVPHDKKEARALLGFHNSEEKWVLFNALSTSDPIKRFPLAKRALELAQLKHGNIRLRLATDIPHNKIPLITAACDLILCTSETEGWPNCVKEALACNVPFVSTDVSDLNDIANQEPSCRVCPADPQILADNIVDVLFSQSQADLRSYVTGMSVDAFCDRLLEIYQSLLSPKLISARPAVPTH